MQVVTDNAEHALTSLLSSINAHAGHWDGWLCLHIESEELNYLYLSPALLSYAEAVLENAFDSLEGVMFFCGHEDLYILAQNVSYANLEEIGRTICALILKDRQEASEFHVYDLADKGLSFIYSVQQRGEIYKLFTERTRQNQISPPRVLLIEDDPGTSWLVKKALKNECTFFSAHGATDGSRLYIDQKPDLVFLDIGLPDGNGLDLLGWMKKEYPGSNIVMFSADDDRETVSNATNQGAQGFIGKPFRKERLIHFLNECKAA